MRIKGRPLATMWKEKNCKKKNGFIAACLCVCMWGGGAVFELHTMAHQFLGHSS